MWQFSSSRQTNHISLWKPKSSHLNQILLTGSYASSSAGVPKKRTCGGTTDHRWRHSINYASCFKFQIKNGLHNVLN